MTAAGDYTATVSGNKIMLVSGTPGEVGGNGLGATPTVAVGSAIVAAATVEPTLSVVTEKAGIDQGSVTTGSTTVAFTQNMRDGMTIELGGTTYEFVTDAAAYTGDNTAIEIGADTAATLDALDAELGGAAGITVDSAKGTIKVDSADADAPDIKFVGGGLTLQVGDTNDAFNKVTVSVDDLSAAGISTEGLNVSNQDAAGASVKIIKDAINKVSTNRANLGSLQNRLEYTINNLDTTAENMTAANSRIRDTDMAKEMMNYTKMNILTQAAQAMLAQANQQPQAILQLLQ